MKIGTIIGITLAGSALTQTALADRDSPFPDTQGGYLTFYLDNDLFAGTDQDYTNGARISWISRDRTFSELGSVQRSLRNLVGDEESWPFFQKITGFDDPEKVRYNYGFSLTQLMFTPTDPEPTEQPVGQRRYAGWLGLGFSLHAKDDKVLNSVEFTLGTTGSNSYAHETQDFIHEIKGVEKFQGWDDQIPNEVTFDLSFDQKRRILPLVHQFGWLQTDAISETGVRLGTFRTEAYLGGFFRAGYQLPPDFSDPRLSGTAYSHRYFGRDSPYTDKWSIYILGGFSAHYVGFDATLDGPLFRNFDTGNERIPNMGELFGGVGIRYRNVELSYVHTLRSREYTQQDRYSEFGTVALRILF
jgi:lipid A 3-O-deacylase